MSVMSFVPLAATLIISWLAWRINRTRRWFTIGEFIFWTVLLLIVLQLIWLRWY